MYDPYFNVNDINDVSFVLIKIANNKYFYLCIQNFK